MASKDNNDLVIGSLTASVSNSTKMLERLLTDLQDNATNLAVLKEQVGSLSDVISGMDGKGSLETRMALIERSIDIAEEKTNDLRGYVKEELAEVCEDITAVNNEHIGITKRIDTIIREGLGSSKNSKLKFVAIIAPGIFALAITVVKLIFGIVG